LRTLPQVSLSISATLRWERGHPCPKERTAKTGSFRRILCGRDVRALSTNRRQFDLSRCDRRWGAQVQAAVLFSAAPTARRLRERPLLAVSSIGVTRRFPRQRANAGIRHLLQHRQRLTPTPTPTPPTNTDSDTPTPPERDAVQFIELQRAGDCTTLTITVNRVGDTSGAQR
jgi:hypothetical protein